MIGSSTGGPEALTELLPRFPADFPAPVLIVQHMPAAFTRRLAERLDALTPLPVREAVDGERLAGRGVRIAPGGYHMGVRRRHRARRIVLTQDPPRHSCRPAVDVLFRTVAELCGPHVLGVVLTGMGQDGLEGCRRIRQAGGYVLVQDRRSSVVWGMPGFVAEAGLAHEVLPLPRIGPRILEVAVGA